MSGLFDLSGKVAIVTGANTGIGQTIAVALAEAGADIAVVGRSQSEATLELIRGMGRKAAYIAADLSTAAPQSTLFDVMRRFVSAVRAAAESQHSKPLDVIIFSQSSLWIFRGRH